MAAALTNSVRARCRVDPGCDWHDPVDRAGRAGDSGRGGGGAHTHALVDQRRAEPADDLITDLVRAQDEDGDRWSDVELVTIVLALVIAGHETTANLIGNGALALLTHPEQLARLRAEPELWPSAVTEPGHGDGHVGFGHGTHYCLGAAPARQECEVALRALVERFPRLTLDTAEPRWLPLPGMRQLAALPVRLR